MRAAGRRRWLAAGAWALAGLVFAAPRATALNEHLDETTTEERLADLSETIETLGVTVRLADGTRHSGRIIVTHYRPKGAGPFPAIVVNHGRAARRDAVQRFRSVAHARYFAARGFAVFVPTRLGYGASGLEPDPENSGACHDKNFGPMAAAAAAQIRATVALAQAKPWVRADKIMLMGQSVGGFAALVAHGESLPGVIGAINSAGGSGGDPRARPGAPCGPERLAHAFAAAAKAGLPRTLWLYSQNDRYWGPLHPRRWHAAYTAAGGKAEFVELPANGRDGHRQFQRISIWRPHVDRYLASLGFAAPRTKAAPARTGFAALTDLKRVPHVPEPQRTAEYRKFLALDVPRAFVIGTDGSYAYAGGRPDALDQALAQCRASSDTCRPYAVDDAVVWPRTTATAAR